MPGWRERTREVVFEAETPAGKAFDLLLLVLIVVSVLLVMFESLPSVRARYGTQLIAAEWVVTALFAVEYVVRLLTAPSARRYARSFFGVVDLLAVLPPLLALAIPQTRALLIVRSLRLLRVFRILRLSRWLADANYLVEAVRTSTRKIGVFLTTVLLINVIVGSAMYVIEGPTHGFTDMFTGVYWSIVTMSTVGFGDVAPATPLGRTVASGLMILGYSVIAVPTGIVSAELSGAERRRGQQHAVEHADEAQGGDPSEEERREEAGEEPADGARTCPDCGAPQRP